jgi:hypothetical protein
MQEKVVPTGFIARMGSRAGNASRQPRNVNKDGFGRLISFACAEPVAVVKHRFPVLSAAAVEEIERLKALGAPMRAPVAVRGVNA